MEGLQPELRQPDRREHVERMTNVEKLGLPWLCQWAAAELNRSWDASPAVPVIQYPEGRVSGMAYYTYRYEEQVPPDQHSLSKRQCEMNAEELAADDALADTEMAEHGRVLTPAQRLLPQTQLARRLKDSEARRNRYHTDPAARLNELQARKDRYEKDADRTREKARREYAEMDKWRSQKNQLSVQYYAAVGSANVKWLYDNNEQFREEALHRVRQNTADGWERHRASLGLDPGQTAEDLRMRVVAQTKKVMQDVVPTGRSVSVGLAKFGLADVAVEALGGVPSQEELYTYDFVDKVNMLLQKKELKVCDIIPFPHNEHLQWLTYPSCLCVREDAAPISSCDRANFETRILLIHTDAHSKMGEVIFLKII